MGAFFILKKLYSLGYKYFRTYKNKMTEPIELKNKNHQAEKKKKGSYKQNRPKNNKKRSNKGNKNPNHSSPIYAAIDLGPNNCRLLVAKTVGSGFKIIDSFSQSVRLGEGLSRDGKLSAAAMDRTICALRICADKMQRRGVTKMRNVATQACREADNHKEFLTRVEKEVQIKLDIIDPEEEARLAVMGCKALLDLKFSHAVVFDVGGGSTEVVWLKIGKYKKPEIIDWISLPYGVVNLSEQFGSKKNISPDRYHSMKETVDIPLSEFVVKNNIKSEIENGKVQLLGSSGTITTLTSMHLGLASYDRSKVDGAWVTALRMQEMCDQLSDLNYEERIKKPSIGEDRAELVVAGCAIIEVIMTQLPIDDIRVADRGIREGMLLDLMELGQRKRRKRRNRYRRFSKNKKPKNTPNSTAQNKD